MAKLWRHNTHTQLYLAIQSDLSSARGLQLELTLALTLAFPPLRMGDSDRHHDVLPCLRKKKMYEGVALSLQLM